MKLLKTILTLSVVTVIIAGCGEEVKEDTLANAKELKVGPKAKPERNITSFSDALRCMDNQMLDYGIHDISILLEDMKDKTGGVKAGARDMLISAISEMTRRSHAIRAITYGKDSGNMIGFLQSANKKTAYSVVPQYGLRGSISQLDKGIASKDAKGGISVGGTVSGEEFGFGGGGAKTANASVMGIDLNVISSADFSLIPGVISKNSVIIVKQGSGKNLKAQISKLGVNFSTNMTKAEGNSQALRNLIELAAIEITGKLTKTPYWKCLGTDENQKDIQNEISDWWYNLVADNTVVAYFQKQLGNRGFYNGPVDNQFNELLTQAIISYKIGVGLPGDGDLTPQFFSALLNQNVPTPPEYVADIAATDQLLVDIGYPTPVSKLQPGENFSLQITPSADAHLYCYYQDDSKKIQRFFPNRFEENSFVKGGKSILLPGAAPFKMFASKSGNTESLACFASRKDIFKDLPISLRETDFENLKYRSIEDIQAEFTKVLGNELGGQYFEVQVEK